MSSEVPRLSILSRGSGSTAARISGVLRRETVAGALLLLAAAVALIWANSPWSDRYHDLRDTTIGPSGLHLNLSLGTWAADGLLAVFFLVVGLELKREFVAGDLKDVRRAVVPIAAAIGGMLVPALIFVAINVRGGAHSLAGWAVPTATDIAFAVAVLAVISSHLPLALRTFLLTLAVVDDLLAVAVIAVFYTGEINLLALCAAGGLLFAFAAATHKGVRSPWLLVPLTIATWLAMHESGIHATVAGVLLGFAVPVSRIHRSGKGMSEHFEYRLRPLSAGLAVPVFAFFAAGVTVGGFEGLGAAVKDPIVIGVAAGLVVGKVVGIVGTTFLVTRLTSARLDDELTWTDVVGIGLLGGIGFTVSLLIGDLAFGSGSAAADHVKVAVLLGSLISAANASVILTIRNRVYRRNAVEELVETNCDAALEDPERSGR